MWSRGAVLLPAALTHFQIIYSLRDTESAVLAATIGEGTSCLSFAYLLADYCSHVVALVHVAR